MLIHQLCRECCSYVIHPLIQPIGWWLEKKLHKIYIDAVKKGRLRALITVSESAKRGLSDLKYLKKLLDLSGKFSLRRVVFKTNIPQQEKKMLLAKSRDARICFNERGMESDDNGGNSL